MPDMQDAIRELQETAIVMAEIQARQAAVLKDHGLLESLQKGQALHEQRMAEHEQRMARLDEKLAEIGEKLDALIDIVDGHIRDPRAHKRGPTPG